MNQPSDETWMRLALQQAQLAVSKQEVPIGAVVVIDGELIASAYNQRESLKEPTAHAELLALSMAAKKLGDWRLDGAQMFVTLEPCLMCFGAAHHSRVKRLVYGCQNPKNPKLLREIYEKWPGGPDMVGGVLESEASEVLTAFFQSLRQEA